MTSGGSVRPGEGLCPPQRGLQAPLGPRVLAVSEARCGPSREGEGRRPAGIGLGWRVTVLPQLDPVSCISLLGPS